MRARINALLICAALLVALQAVVSSSQIPAAAAQSGPLTAVIVLPDDGRQAFIDEIDAAEASVDLYIYLLSDEEIIRALIRAHVRGVDVRVMLEPEPYGGAQTEQETWRRLQTAGVDVRWSRATFRFAHIKMMILDHSVALIMNLNLTRAAFEQNREFAVLTTNPDLVGEASRLFAADWTGNPQFEPAALVTSPENSRNAILALIHGAENSIDIYAEALTDPEVLDELVAGHRRGLVVRIVIADLAGTIPALEEPGFLARSGIDIRVLGAPYVHAKVIIVDGNTALVGSQNLTANSLDGNREAGVIVTSPLAVSRISVTFEADFAVAAPVDPS